MREDVVQVGSGYLDLLVEQMGTIARQGAAITEYVESQVCSPVGFGEPPCVLAPLAGSMDRLATVFDGAFATFADRWGSLQATLADSATVFAVRDARSSEGHRSLTALLDVRHDAAA